MVTSSSPSPAAPHTPTPARAGAVPPDPDRQTFVLDTSVLLSDPGALTRFAEHDVVLPLVVVSELEGFEVHQAVDGLAALDTARAVDPDVVTLDVMMPRLDGIATARRLRADPVTRRARIVLISARTGPADVERGQDAGADAYVTKPFDPDDVVAAVRRLAARA